MTSIYGNEDSNARQNGIKASARAIIRAEDYGGETILDYSGGRSTEAVRYTVYRTYLDRDNIELYLSKKKGEQK
ncbi:hypothetical protein [Caproicibacterium sp. BJN0003]|uniref:hypothetical protein n=1 Tax=Caproicibacterium sp. BJN0003 TaxID=2994078 RepID=UPI00224FE14B|nr:hypothetical protein [Caproicibacterium sp. BJN0003]UZT82143.1 hypothetical protein OP489_11855 [Caproicibacterium sp. BJN0003]